MCWIDRSNQPQICHIPKPLTVLFECMKHLVSKCNLESRSKSQKQETVLGREIDSRRVLYTNLEPDHMQSSQTPSTLHLIPFGK